MADPGPTGACCICGKVRKLNDASECGPCAEEWADDDSDSAMFDPSRIEHNH